METIRLQFVDKQGSVKAEISAEIADTPTSRREGLSKRAFLSPGSGMFFDKVGAYWMKDVNFPLDILFLDKQGTVLEKQYMPVVHDPDPFKPLYTPTHKEAAYALELPANWFDEKDLSVGVKVWPVKPVLTTSGLDTQ